MRILGEEQAMLTSNRESLSAAVGADVVLHE
jgi:hypothetical protein